MTSVERYRGERYRGVKLERDNTVWPFVQCKN